MSQPVWSYSATRDTKFWKLLVVGAAGAVPAAILLPVSLSVAAAAGDADGWVLGAALLTPALLLALWAAVLWGIAARRVMRLRRLAQCGVQVQATVQNRRLLRGKYSKVVWVVVWFEYHVDGKSYHAKRRTTFPGVVGRAREIERLDIVIDPVAPWDVALLVDGRLD